MGQVFSVEHNLNATSSVTKAVMLLVYENHSLTPLSILDFVRAPASYSGNPILIVEPFNGEIPITTAPIRDKLSYTDTYRAIHTIYKLTPYQFKTYRLWLLTSPTISQSLTTEVIEFSRKFSFLEFNSTIAIEASSIFFDLKTFSSFSSAIRPPSAGIRCSSPVMPSLSSQISNKTRINRSFGTKLMTTFMENPGTEEAESPRLIQESNDIDFVVSGLFIGNEAAAQNRELLSQYKITHIVNLNAHTSSPAFPGSFTYYSVKLNDHVFEVLDDKFWNAYEFTKNAINQGGRVLVHCRRGISRSAALCVAYLMEEKKMTFNEAFNALKRQRPAIDINQGFVDQLKARERINAPPPKKKKPLLSLYLPKK
ncbi:hypothetical protein M9Y10_045048 [Tritrichomonas musculus]|uniref:protein-tyrosine-phosphatase n=1 Tax=Tritrichomonas musculus TaxID=1915356 RepID=A0ABR2JUI3_9EUKA